MKKLIVFLLVLSPVFSLKAQMDDKFYYPSKKMNKIESLSYVENNYYIDNDTLTSITLIPKIKKPKASIIYFHGAGGNVTTYVNYVKPLVENGYKVIMIDLRGYGKSTGKPTHLNSASDAQYIFNTILKNSSDKKQKIIIYGASMGTQVAANLAKNNEDKIHGLVLDGCISSFTDIAADTSPKEQQQMIRQFLPSPYAAKEDVKGIKRIPILFIHSKEDKSVPFSHQETVFNNTSSPNKSVWIYTGEHLMAPVLFEEEFLKRINLMFRS
nr:alpha/beta fold hydrolase [uncultured Flavobacterium sp.]